MLKKFQVHNYKNFKDTLTFDFGKVGGYKFNQECIQNNVIGKCIVYGRNATGKTNLGNALTDIFDVIFTDVGFMKKENILNADSKENTSEFYYEFNFDEESVIYKYTKNADGNLKMENLTINGKDIFSLEFEACIFSNLNLELIGAETIQLDRYIASQEYALSEMEDNAFKQIPFLRFILNNSPLMPESILRKLENYISSMGLYGVGQQIFTGVLPLKRTKVFLNYLSKSNNLKDFEDFLNIMGIPCKLYLEILPDEQYELYFQHERLVPFFKTASSGTLSLVNFYRRFITTLRKPSFIYMDEFDAFYHYEMSEKLVNYFKMRFEDCQIVMTTHNTNLMSNQLMRPDCLFILSRDGKLTALCDATERELREGHNLEKMYIAGEFEQYE